MNNRNSNFKYVDLISTSATLLLDSLSSGINNNINLTNLKQVAVNGVYLKEEEGVLKAINAEGEQLAVGTKVEANVEIPKTETQGDVLDVKVPYFTLLNNEPEEEYTVKDYEAHQATHNKFSLIDTENENAISAVFWADDSRFNIPKASATVLLESMVPAAYQSAFQEFAEPYYTYDLSNFGDFSDEELQEQDETFERQPSGANGVYLIINNEIYFKSGACLVSDDGNYWFCLNVLDTIKYKENTLELKDVKVLAYINNDIYALMPLGDLMKMQYGFQAMKDGNDPQTAMESFDWSPIESAGLAFFDQNLVDISNLIYDSKDYFGVEYETVKEEAEVEPLNNLKINDKIFKVDTANLDYAAENDIELAFGIMRFGEDIEIENTTLVVDNYTIDDEEHLLDLDTPDESEGEPEEDPGFDPSATR